MIFYLYERGLEAFVEEVKAVALLPDEIQIMSIDAFLRQQPGDVDHLIISGSLASIKRVIPTALEKDVTLGITPTAEQKNLIRTFALPGKLEDAVKLALEPAEDRIDLLYCNGQIVLQEAVIGDAPPLDQFESSIGQQSWRERLGHFWKTLLRVRHLKHTKMKITVANGNEMKFSAAGVVGIEYNNRTFASKLIASELSVMDGKSTVVILSPQSMLQYVGYLFKSLVSHLSSSRLPASVGFIRSSLLEIEPQTPLKIVIDSQEAGESPASLETKQAVLRLSVGEAFWERNSREKNTKESMKVDHLPSDEERIGFLGEGIPLFSHASQEQYAALFTNLREESKLNATFLTLLILSTLIATFGLFVNSSSVIIGAMLLAPLMQPIISLSMGVLRQDSALLGSGAKTIAAGVLAVIVTAALTSVLTPIERLTPEMAGRLSPTILDLFIAIVSGVAAAYVKSNEKIASSLAGVAIAVALVPPIAVSGIGLGWGEWHMFYSAFLLFVTNLVGIVLAAALTFTALGFSPLHLARKGVMVWLMIVALVAMPLYSAFRQMQEDIEIQRILTHHTFNVGRHDVTLNNVKILHHGEEESIACEVLSSGILLPEEKRRLKEEVLQRIDKKIEVVVSYRYRL
ncbi:hypothetical protein MNB_SV-4-31 [hydrothermal vent metagenome]|uniref:TIGR00341 family protein n=1 Tax=hydrothermal vent metagenome TaxID=652676 RepID=A0A1W1EAA4_9ZZZZ